MLYAVGGDHPFHGILFSQEDHIMQILETHDLKKYYGTGDTQVRALDGVNLAVEQGEFLSIVGTSGSG